MRGFTLLEILIATTFFLLVLITGYQILWTQNDLIRFAASRVKPDMESNYRALLLKRLLEYSSQPFRQDPMLETAPIFFQDLNFGQTTRSDAFSIATAIGSPMRFQRNGTVYRYDPITILKVKDTLLLGGATLTQEFAWRYARVTKVDVDSVEISFLNAGAIPEEGSWIQVEIIGIQFKEGSLYWISPGGQFAPFLGPLDEFHYRWNAPEVIISWRIGGNEYEVGAIL